MSKRVDVRLDDRLAKILDAIAFLSGNSKTEVMRQALRKMYKRDYKHLICPKCLRPYERIEIKGTWLMAYCEDCDEYRRVGRW